MEVSFHSFLTSVLDWGLVVTFTQVSEESTSDIHRTGGWVGRKAGQEAFEERQSRASAGNRTTNYRTFNS